MNKLKEMWSYNEWPDVDLDGNIISHNKNANLKESCADKKSVKESFEGDFENWYDSLSEEEQQMVDNHADALGLPMYADCEDVDLAGLKDWFEANKANK